LGVESKKGLVRYGKEERLAIEKKKELVGYGKEEMGGWL
jgi:hypothetical protein